MNKIRVFVGVFSLCLAHDVRAGEISVKNWNCVWQGFSRTNEVKLHIWRWGWPAPIMGSLPAGVNKKELPRQCTNVWIAVHVGRTETVKVTPLANVEETLPGNTRVEPVAGSCLYAVQAEGVLFSAKPMESVNGQNNSKFVCRLDWAGVCQCGTE